MKRLIWMYSVESGEGFQISKLGKQYKCPYRLVLEAQVIRVNLWEGCHWVVWPHSYFLMTWTPWLKRLTCLSCDRDKTSKLPIQSLPILKGILCNDTWKLMSLKTCAWYLGYKTKPHLVYVHKPNGVQNFMNNILYLHPLSLKMGGK